MSCAHRISGDAAAEMKGILVIIYDHGFSFSILTQFATAVRVNSEERSRGELLIFIC